MEVTGSPTGLILLLGFILLWVCRLQFPQQFKFPFPKSGSVIVDLVCVFHLYVGLRLFPLPPPPAHSGDQCSRSVSFR
jgi:hypothetical protein